MQSRLLVNIALLLLVAVLVYFSLMGGDKTTEMLDTLTTIKADSINQIVIHHNKRVIHIEKTGSLWQLTSPITIAANQFRMDTVLKLLGTVSYAKYDADSLELDKYGLETPDTSISLNKHKIDFGIVNPITTYRYVKINNDVHLIDDYYYPMLSSQMGTLISRYLQPTDSKINKLVLPEQTLALNTDEKWTSTKGGISADAIAETLYNWRNIEAFGVHDYFERESLGAIEVYIDNVYGPVKFFITDTDPWLVIARPEIKLEYHFNLDHYDSLLRPGAEKKLPDEFSNDAQSVSPEEFMKAMQQQDK